MRFMHFHGIHIFTHRGLIFLKFETSLFKYFSGRENLTNEYIFFGPRRFFIIFSTREIGFITIIDLIVEFD